MDLEGMEDILQDFLVEAKEILSQLDEQLVQLEAQGSDKDLLNTVFRGFHTIKGGAGFLNLEPVVEVCHRAENTFDVLRKGKVQLTSDMMDTIFTAYDTVRSMLDQISGGDFPADPDPHLLEELDAIASGQVFSAPSKPVVEEESVGAESIDTGFEELGEAPASQEPEEYQGEDMEEMLDAMEEEEAEEKSHDQGGAEPGGGELFIEDEPASAGDDEITEEEFEALLDALEDQGEGAVAQSEEEGEPPEEIPFIEDTPSVDEDSAATGGEESDEITEEEFDALLDRLEAVQQESNVAEAPPPVAKRPEEKPKPVVAAEAPPPKLTKEAPPLKEAPPKVEKEMPFGEEKPAAGVRKSGAVGKLAEGASAGEDTTIRVDTRRLDEVMNLVGELVLVRNRILTLASQSDQPEGMESASAHLDLVTSSLQAAVMKTRMQPIKRVFGRFPRLVRDLARSLKKEVNLVMRGEETDLDKTLVEELADPLVHLVRNAVDHGIESPLERERKGKPREGKLLLSAKQEGDRIVIEIGDDGKGIDPEVIKRKAVENGLIDWDMANRMEERQVFNLIFNPGFSTKDEVSDISGRGVGMDVVKTHISKLNGVVEINSVLGVGTSFNIHLPLTLAIIPTLMVGVCDQRFALPLGLVREIFNLDMAKTKMVNGQQVAVIRQEVLPLVYLAQWLELGYDHQRSGESFVVVTTIGEQQIGLVVNALYGQEEVVIKSLGEMLQHIKGFAGATITGDGRVVLILDAPALLAAHSF